MKTAHGPCFGHLGVASFAVLASLCARAAEPAGPAWLSVEAGVFEVAGVEYFVDAYRIQARATAGEYMHDACEAPRPEE